MVVRGEPEVAPQHVSFPSRSLHLGEWGQCVAPGDGCELVDAFQILLLLLPQPALPLFPKAAQDAIGDV